jgi:ferredoxin
MTLTTILILCISTIVLFPTAALSVISILEGEKKAASRAALITFLRAVVLFSALLLHEPGRILVIGIYLGLLALIVIVLLIPIGKILPEMGTPANRVDEREIIFARARLEPGSEQYKNYYNAHPDHQPLDDKSRTQPGLFSTGAKYTEPLHSAAAVGSFSLTNALREGVDGPISTDLVKRSPKEFTDVVNYLAKYYGARDSGITDLKPTHIYSHIGRGTGTYGDPVDLDHQYGIAITVEMDFKMTASAPYPPITMESGRQYVESARVSVQLAAAIRSQGYSARAHIDGNYRVIAPLVARDAGLGEIGRMGLLMTPKLGPRVRVGVVTTDLPLIPNSYQPDSSVLDFCRICKKCAENCPSQSIPHGDREVNNGVLRWKINPESCYHYWTVIGTDCGKCMAVCPYSHPDNWIHNLVRWGNSRSGAFRRAALILDDFFYGRKPESRNKSVFNSNHREQ